jgi:hypothetical protein
MVRKFKFWPYLQPCKKPNNRRRHAEKFRRIKDLNYNYIMAYNTWSKAYDVQDGYIGCYSPYINPETQGLRICL